MDEAVYQDGKYILVRDYTSDWKEEDLTEELAADPTPEAMAMLDRAVAAYEREQALPHAIDPQCAADFDALVPDCDRLMQAFSGKLTAVVNEKTYEAYITMECIYLLFLGDESMDLLQRIAEKAIRIDFMPMTFDTFMATIDMPYSFIIPEEGEA